MKLSLYQVAAVMEKEIYLSGEGDNVCRAQIPARQVKGQGSEKGGFLCTSHPLREGAPRLPVPQAFGVPWHAEASLVVREVAG